jgi:hypothetical protein
VCILLVQLQQLHVVLVGMRGIGHLHAETKGEREKGRSRIVDLGDIQGMPSGVFKGLKTPGETERQSKRFNGRT